MSDIKFKVGRCPFCGKSFPIAYAFKPKIEEGKLKELLHKYRYLQKYIKNALILSVKKAEGRDYNLFDLERILYTIYHTVSGREKFLKALKIYYEREYWKSKKGLPYFISMVENMELKIGEFGYANSGGNTVAKEDTKGAGKFY